MVAVTALFTVIAFVGIVFILAYRIGHGDGVSQTEQRWSDAAGSNYGRRVR